MGKFSDSPFTVRQVDIPRVFFTSDSHFGHENILKYSGRPWASIAAHDAGLTRLWNQVVGEKDWVFHLGDVTLGDDAEKYLWKLNGRILLLKLPWHHDGRWIKKLSSRPNALAGLEPLCESATDEVWLLESEQVVEIKGLGLNGYPYVIHLGHYPIDRWDRRHYGSVHLHGHAHGMHVWDDGVRAMDVGVDCTSFKPMSLTSVLNSFPPPTNK